MQTGEQYGKEGAAGTRERRARLAIRIFSADRPRWTPRMAAQHASCISFLFSPSVFLQSFNFQSKISILFGTRIAPFARSPHRHRLSRWIDGDSRWRSPSVLSSRPLFHCGRWRPLPSCRSLQALLLCGHLGHTHAKPERRRPGRARARSPRGCRRSATSFRRPTRCHRAHSQDGPRCGLLPSLSSPHPPIPKLHVPIWPEWKRAFQYFILYQIWK